MADAHARADPAFTAEVREFLDREFTPALRREADAQTGVLASPELARRWLAVLHRRGWAAPGWPLEYGGTGWTPLRRYLFEQECASAGTPILPGMGLLMCGPVLMKFGSEEQKAFFLPRILSGEHYWCQGYSEPGAGSDLAALSCRAERVEDLYVINGTKIWTTHAHAANWIFLLVRSSREGKPQQGITFLLCPMDAPGISVRPIRSMSGDHEVNQVFLDGVRIPASRRVGEENGGWTVAKYLLEHERGGGSRSARLKALLLRIRRTAQRQRRHGRALLQDAAFRRRLTELTLTQAVLEATEWRLLTSQRTGSRIGDTTASILKLSASESLQQATALAVEALGEAGIVDYRAAPAQGTGAEDGDTADRDWQMARYLNHRAATIFGGASEIQRDILARAFIGS